jgi:hypothetical protein
MATRPTSAAPGASLTAERNGVRYGLLTGVVLSVYTLVAAFMGFFSRIEAGSLDVLILVMGSVLAIRHFRQVRGNHMPYLGGYGTGIICAMVASVILGVVAFGIISFMSESIDLTQIQSLFGENYSTIVALLAIILMGTMTGVITSLVAMQYYKAQVSDPLAMMKEA